MPVEVVVVVVVVVLMVERVLVAPGAGLVPRGFEELYPGGWINPQQGCRS